MAGCVYQYQTARLKPFHKKIREWFSDTTANDGKTLEQFCNAFVDKDTEKIEELFGDYLWNTIKYKGYRSLQKIKRKFLPRYPARSGGLQSKLAHQIKHQSGTSYSDILVEVPNNRTGIVIELKYSENGDMDAACDEGTEPD